jgi:hypothetical protein
LGKFIHSKGINREIKGIDYLYRQGTILMSDTGDKGTNFHFNESELDLLADTTFLTAKRKLTEKIIARFGELVTVYNEVIIPYSGKLPPESLVRNGKISKGENYRGFPFIVLDHPATFGKDGIFALRTLFWWGNSFSVTFHISGKYLELLPEDFPIKIHQYSNQDIYICINEQMWVHHVEPGNYILLIDYLESDHDRKLTQHGFLKLAIWVPVSEYHQLKKMATDFLRNILTNLK